jgi:hypothetical protein
MADLHFLVESAEKGENCLFFTIAAGTQIKFLPTESRSPIQDFSPK